jgi:hypothetical protein
MGKREWKQWRMGPRVDPMAYDTLPPRCRCRGCSERTHDGYCRACHASGCDSRLDECCVPGTVEYRWQSGHADEYADD